MLDSSEGLPGQALRTSKMPGHWLLARLGKRVLRPGGSGLTQSMLASLAVRGQDCVVEFAPGLGHTAQALLQQGPRRYVGVERDADAVRWTQGRLPSSPHIEVIEGTAEKTGLADATADVALGEAILSITTPRQKRAMMQEAYRILRPGGRYGIHELSLVPDDLDDASRQRIAADLSNAIHVGARPLTQSEWIALLQEGGFRIAAVHHAPMRLLEASRMLADEGLAGTLRFCRNLLRDREALQRVLQMRRIFRRHRRNMAAIAIVAIKD